MTKHAVATATFFGESIYKDYLRGKCAIICDFLHQEFGACISRHHIYVHSHIVLDLCGNVFISFMRVYSARVHNMSHTGHSNNILEDSIDVTFHHCSAPLVKCLSLSIAVQVLEREMIYLI